MLVIFPLLLPIIPSFFIFARLTYVQIVPVFGFATLFYIYMYRMIMKGVKTGENVVTLNIIRISSPIKNATVAKSGFPACLALFCGAFAGVAFGIVDGFCPLTISIHTHKFYIG